MCLGAMAYCASFGMVSQTDKSKRRLPRFTLRFLLVVLTLGCVLMAGWKPLRQRAFADVQAYELATLDASSNACSSPFPLIIANDGIGSNGDPFGERTTRRYYVWLFGYVIKMPFEKALR
jgi:hypothetical protein